MRLELAMNSPKENWQRLTRICQEFAEFFESVENDEVDGEGLTYPLDETIVDLGMALAGVAEMVTWRALYEKGRDLPEGVHERLANVLFSVLAKEMSDLCGEDILGWSSEVPKPKKKSRRPKATNKRKRLAP